MASRQSPRKRKAGSEIATPVVKSIRSPKKLVLPKKRPIVEIQMKTKKSKKNEFTTPPEASQAFYDEALALIEQVKQAVDVSPEVTLINEQLAQVLTKDETISRQVAQDALPLLIDSVLQEESKLHQTFSVIKSFGFIVLVAALLGGIAYYDLPYWIEFIYEHGYVDPPPSGDRPISEQIEWLYNKTRPEYKDDLVDWLLYSG